MNNNLKLASAINGIIGFTQGIKAGDTMTEGYINRLHDYYIPNLEACLEQTKPSEACDE